MSHSNAKICVSSLIALCLMHTYLRPAAIVLIFWGILGCKSLFGPTAEQEAQRDAAVRFVQLVANYSPETAEKNFAKARALLTGPEQKRFGEGILGAELSAVKAIGRSQHFQVSEEEVQIISSSSDATVIEVPGVRTRSIGKSTTRPIRIIYSVTVLAAVNPRRPGKPPMYPISAVSFEFPDGEQAALSAEQLLERFKEASQAAEEERQKFKEAVSLVNEDLKEHEEKVQKNVEALSQSLDQLGTKVRKLTDETRELKEQRSKPPEKSLGKAHSGSSPEKSPSKVRNVQDNGS